MKIFFTSLLVSILIPFAAFADFTIATVNVNQILNESKEAQSKKKELDELSAKAKKKVEDKKKVVFGLTCFTLFGQLFKK